MTADPSSDLILAGSPPLPDADTDVLVIGAGAAGLVAALTAAAAGAEVLVVERDTSPSGSTSLSSGYVPAAGTCFQRAAGIADDTPERFLADIQAKSGGSSEPDTARTCAEAIGPTLEWLADRYGLAFRLLADVSYPGHSRPRMHALVERTGAALHAALLAAAEREGIAIVCGARARALYRDGDLITGVALERVDGLAEHARCRALILASSGFGGCRSLVARHLPGIEDAPYHGHPGNTGDALAWGQALGAQLRDLSGYQGHGSLAHPHGILITWALMGEGALLVNAQGERFVDESAGYSEAAVPVLGQTGGTAFVVFDERCHRFALAFPDYRQAVEAGAVRQADDIAGLAHLCRLPATALADTVEQAARAAGGQAQDPFSREFGTKPPLAPPFFAVRVTGALFHTQGGLVVDEAARVRRAGGGVFANLLAAGGAACGVSGPDVSGYLSGNGLLSAIALGGTAGRSAAAMMA